MQVQSRVKVSPNSEFLNDDGPPPVGRAAPPQMDQILSDPRQRNKGLYIKNIFNNILRIDRTDIAFIYRLRG